MTHLMPKRVGAEWDFPTHPALHSMVAWSAGWGGDSSVRQSLRQRRPDGITRRGPLRRMRRRNLALLCVAFGRLHRRFFSMIGDATR